MKFDGWPCKTKGHLFYATSSFVHHFVPIGEFKLELQSGNAQSGTNSEPCDHQIWQMTLQNNRAPLLCYFKLCASFHTHWWIQTRVTVRKGPIWVKFDDFFSRATLKFDGWPCKPIGHLFYATSTLCSISCPLVNSNLSYSPETPNLGQIRSRATLKFDGWPSKTIGHLFYATSSFLHHFVAIGEFKLELQSGNAQSGSNLTIFRAVRPWNLTDDLAKQ